MTWIYMSLSNMGVFCFVKLIPVLGDWYGLYRYEDK